MTLQTGIPMTSGTIILLNGTSSSGKTSIGRAIQQFADEPWLLLGADILGAICPPRYNGGDRATEGFNWLPAGPGETALVLAPWGQALIADWHRAIGTLARAGQNVVVDHILQDRGWLADCVEAWRDLLVLFVGVRCPLDVAEARESARPYLKRGYVRWSHPRVHAHDGYDLEVDTAAVDPEGCARMILDRLANDRPFDAFHRPMARPRP
jgi:chloramphenicol 3-O phosphotransferase